MNEIMKPREATRVLVTGGAGFIGKHLIRSLLTEGYQVRSLDLNKPDICDVNLESMDGSFTNSECIENALVDVDIIYHLASTTIPQKSNEYPIDDINTNLAGSVDLINKSILAGVKRFIFVSSGGTVYGVPSYLPVDENHPTNPLCSYGIVKLAIEKYLLMYQQVSPLDCSIVRLSNPYGENQNPKSGLGVITTFCDKAIRGERLEIWGDGSVVRDYIHISDVVKALLAIVKNDLSNNPIINVGYGVGHSLNDVIKLIERTLKRPVNKNYHPGRDFDIQKIYLDNTMAKQKLSWKPSVSLNRGVEMLLQSLVEKKAR